MLKNNCSIKLHKFSLQKSPRKKSKFFIEFARQIHYHSLKIFLSHIFTFISYLFLIYYIITIIGFIIIFINFSILFFSFFFPFFLLLFFLILFCFFFLFPIKQLLFSPEMVKVSRLLCLFVCLSVYLFVLFLELKLHGNNSQPHYFSPVPNMFTIFFIYCYFNIILHFILNFTLSFCHSFYYELILRYLKSITS